MENLTSSQALSIDQVPQEQDDTLSSSLSEESKVKFQPHNNLNSDLSEESLSESQESQEENWTAYTLKNDLDQLKLQFNKQQAVITILSERIDLIMEGFHALTNLIDSSPQ
jgi:hypothetical protein